MINKEQINDLIHTFGNNFHIYDKNNISVIDLADYNEFKRIWNETK
jgi:hypothetical protein